MADSNFRGDNSGAGYAQYVGIGFTLLSILALPAIIGFFVDRLLDTLPLLLLVGLGIGFVAELAYIYTVIQKSGGRG